MKKKQNAKKVVKKQEKKVAKTKKTKNVKEKAKGISRSAVKTSIKDNKKVVNVDPKGKGADDEIMSASDLIANLQNEQPENRDKREKAQKIVNKAYKEIIHEEEISERIEKNMPVYGYSIILERALCDIDGLKPIQRKIMWSLYQLGGMDKLLKSSMVTGDIQGKYSPHADCYDSVTLLTREREGLLTPLVKGKGSFGKHYSRDTEPSAPRYTEIKLEPVCHEMLDSVKKIKDNMKDNYTKTLKEPKLLMCAFPLLLANENNGIAYSLATEIGSFNLNELCDATIEIVKNYKKDDKELYKTVSKVMPTFDFTTGCDILLDKNEMKNIFLTGDGKIGQRALFYDNKAERTLEVSGIPYTTVLEKIIEAIMKAYGGKRFEEISRVVDATDVNGLKIAIEYKRGTDVEELKKKLLVYTPCQENFNSNIEYIYKNRPRHNGVIRTIKDWVEARREWLKKEFTTDLEDAKHKLNLLEGLQKILLDIDKAIKIVRQSKTDEEVISGLMKAFKLDNEQAEFVANIKLRNLNKDYILNKIKEIKDLKEEIKRLEKILKGGIDDEMIKQLEEIKKKYGYERKSKIITEWEDIEQQKAKITEKMKAEAKEKNKVNVEGNSIIFTNEDSVRKVSEGSSAQTPSGFVKNVVPNAGEIIAFTNEHQVFKYPVAELPSSTKIKDIKKIGKKLENGEQILFTTPLIEGKKILLVFGNKKWVKCDCACWKTENVGYKQFKKGYCDKDNLIHIEMLDEDKEIELFGKKVNTATCKEVGSRTSNGTKIPKVK